MGTTTPRDGYSRGLLVAGLIARTWLWFVAGCLIITLLPLLIGWRPYVITSGSMEPRIGVGDVVIAAPESDPEALLGRVVVFDDQNVVGRITVHRAIAANDDGTFTTKGDANATADTASLPLEDVRGLGRLLVMFVGLPLVWLQSGQWIPLALLLASLVVATWFVGRDQEDDEDDDADPDGDEANSAASGEAPTPASHAAPTVGVIARVIAPVRAGLLSADLWPSGGPRRRPQLAMGVTSSAELAPVTLPAPARVAARARRDSPVRGLVRALQSADLWPVSTPRRHSRPSRPSALGGLVERARRALRPKPLAPVMRVAQVGALSVALLSPVAGAAFTATTSAASNAWATAVSFLNYTASVQSLSPYLYWKLDETGTTSTAVDSSGNGRSGNYRANGGTTYFTKGVTGALTGEAPNRSVTLRNANSCIATSSNTAISAPPQVTLIAWFRTTSNQGGKLLGFEQPRTGTAIAGSGGTYDRHLYLDGNGRVWFGVYNGAHVTLSSGTGYNNGAWHMAAATFGSSGMRLYVDGILQGSDVNTGAEATTGWWRAGCGNLAGWGGSWTGPNNPGTATDPTQNRPLAGSLDEVSVWHSVLTPAQITSLYTAATTP